MPKVNRKQIIFERAAELFKEKGYSATSMRDLAEAVGIEPSSLYSHISSKEQLLTKICMDTAQRFTTGLQKVRSSQLDAKQQLYLVIDLHIAIARDAPSSVTVFTDEWRHLNPTDLSDFEKQRKAYQQSIRQIVESGMQNGTFKSIDPRTATKTILTSLRWVHTWQRKSSSVDYDQIAADIKKLFVEGLSHE